MEHVIDRFHSTFIYFAFALKEKLHDQLKEKERNFFFTFNLLSILNKSFSVRKKYFLTFSIEKILSISHMNLSSRKTINPKYPFKTIFDLQI